MTLLVYWPVNNHQFITYDDGEYVNNNPHVRQGLTIRGISWAFTSFHSANWHPVTWLSHMVDCQLYGMNPGRHHLTNLIFHIANTLLLCLVLFRMSGKIRQSAFVAALFALHPLHVESVAWISERKDVVSTFFWMLTLLSYAWYAEKPGLNRYLPALIFFILGLMSKPMLVTLPFVLLLLDYWPLGRISHGAGRLSHNKDQEKKRTLFLPLILEKIPFFILAAASCIVTFFAQKGEGALYSIQLLPLKVRISNALFAYTGYMGKMFWPFKLSCFYPFQSISVWQVAGSIVLLGFITLFVIKCIKNHPWLAFGWLWYIGTLVPVIGLVQVGAQSMADRYTYIPLIGIFIMISWGGPYLVYKACHGNQYAAKMTIATITALMLTFVTAITCIQVRYWKNSIILFERAIEVTVDNYVAHYCLGNALIAQNKFSKAALHYSEALKIKPHNARLLRELGLALAQQEDFDTAIQYFSEALHIDPLNADVHSNLGNALAMKGYFDKAALHFNKALKINPDHADAHNNLGLVLTKQGKIQAAVSHYAEALRVQPNYLKSLNNLAWLFATHKNPEIRNGARAVTLAEHACNITGYKQPAVMDILAAAYAEAGNFDKARLVAQEALKLLNSNGNHVLKERIEKRLQLYQSDHPYRTK